MAECGVGISVRSELERESARVRELESESELERKSARVRESKKVRVRVKESKSENQAARHRVWLQYIEFGCKT